MTNNSYPIARQSSVRHRYGTTVSVALLLSALSMAFGFPGESTTPAGPQFEGSFDKLVVESVGGWAWDGLRPTAAISVEIYDGLTLIGTISAQEFRQDLKSAGKGDGKHAFNYALPLTLRDGRPHTISIRYAGTPSELPGSPRTLLFPKS